MLSAPYMASCKVTGSTYRRLALFVTVTVTPTPHNPAPVGQLLPHITMSSILGSIGFAHVQNPIMTTAKHTSNSCHC